MERQAAAGPAVPFSQVQSIVQQRCAVCHSLHPTQPGFSSAPLGIRFDTRAEIERQVATNVFERKAQGLLHYGFERRMLARLLGLIVQVMNAKFCQCFAACVGVFFD